MASISSLTSSGSTSTSSLYGTTNIISGLASGLDTETLIQNSITGYQSKITSLQQQQQMLTWKQDAYRSIIDKMVSLTQKYTSYTSKTNLYSSSFFNKAVSTTANGANAANVTATGKSSSEIQINAIKQLATAAKYTVGVGSTGIISNTVSTTNTSGAAAYMTTADAIDWSQAINVSDISGSMTLSYGSKSLSITFDKSETFSSAQELADAIKDKLGDLNYTTSAGATVKADTIIDVSVSEDGTISFSDKTDAGNSVYIKSASGDLVSGTNGLSITTGEDATSFTVTDASAMSHEADLKEYVDGQTVSFTLNGVTKKLALPDLTSSESGSETTDLAAALNTALGEAFGAGKIEVGSNNGALTFTVAQGSTLSVTSEVGDALGLGDNGITNYLDTSATLGELLSGFGEEEQDLVINGVTIGSYSQDTALETVINAINSNSEAGVKVSYSKLTNQFVFTASETGSAGKIEFGEGLASDLFAGGTSAAGQDAVFTATVNDTEMELTRSTNVADIDGLSVTLKGTFGYEGDVVVDGTEEISFTTKSDADTIVDAIQSFVDDYNALAKEIYTAYSTQPATKSDGSSYKPLTDDDKEDMTDSAIETYEEKVKQGLLFGESDLSSLYSKLRSAITPSGSDGNALSSIGITTEYEDGITTLTLDEETLREALEANPDEVRDVFTKSTSTGSSTNGLMTKLKTTLETYSSTSLAGTGILVKRAGTKLSAVSLLNNTLQSQINGYDDEIEKWQDKMSDKVDYYTNKFTALEQLISTMNNQSSMLSSMLG
ncbi:MAG: flagellar hook protein [Clostridia bacterium]|nr:flagellar hook protein [Clostridia bacterium]